MSDTPLEQQRYQAIMRTSLPMTRRPHLAYTLALDHPPGATGHRTMAKMLVLSLLRTGFRGDITVLRNSPAPLFHVPRRGVTEIEIETDGPDSDDFWHYAQQWKYRARHMLDVTGYDKVLYLDADFLALRDITPLLDEPWDIACYPEPRSHAGQRFFNTFIADDEPRLLAMPGVNGGLLGVSAPLFRTVTARWERIAEGPAPREKFFADQAALTRLIHTTARRKRMLTLADLATPFSYDPRPQDYLAATLVHLAGSNNLEEKLRFMFGLYLNTFFFDPQTLLLHILET